MADAVMQRTAAFWRWVEDGLGRPELLPDRHPHGRLGYHHVPALPQLPFDVHVIGLDSAWLAGDDQGKLWLTERQHDKLLQDEHGQPWIGFRLALVHHLLEELAQPDIGPARRGLARSADLLLHGHQHDPVGSCLVDLDGDALRVLAAGCLYESTADSELKNGCQRIDVVLDDVGRSLRAETWFRAWSSRGHWHSDSSLYRGLTDGRMVWNAWGSGSGASSYEPRAISPASPNRHNGSGRVVGSSPVELSGSEPASGDREVLAARLRRAAAQVYDKHDFASLGAGGPRRDVTLRQICVPIRLRVYPNRSVARHAISPHTRCSIPM